MASLCGYERPLVAVHEKKHEISPATNVRGVSQNSSQGCYLENIISRMVFEKRKPLILGTW